MGTSLLLALLLVGLQNPGTVSSGQNAAYVVGAAGRADRHRLQRAAVVRAFPGRERRPVQLSVSRPRSGRRHDGGRDRGARQDAARRRLPAQSAGDRGVEQFRSQNVFVMGEVRTPGRYTLDRLRHARRGAGAGGLDRAVRRAARCSSCIRARPPSESPTLPGSGDADVQRINLRDIQAGKLAANVTIRDGDTIFVPKAQRFFVTGNVRSPGAYVLEPNLTVLQAISMAGGLTDRGSHAAPADHPQQEGVRRQADRHRAGRRHDRRAATAVVRMLFLNPTGRDRRRRDRAARGDRRSAATPARRGRSGLIAGADGPLVRARGRSAPTCACCRSRRRLSRLGEWS